MNRRLFACLTVWLGLALSSVATAHDFWLQPDRFWVEPGARLNVLMYVGHGADRQVWNVASSRIATLRSVGPNGTEDARAALGGSATAGRGAFQFREPGVYVIALESNHAVSALPAAQFQTYARDEGLTPILRHRAQSRTTREQGREIYSRRAKAIVQVGGAGVSPAPYITRALGMTLEIVPERDPTTLSGASHLPVLVHYRGAPLSGARIVLRNLQDDARALVTHTTDREGRAVFAIPGAGEYLLNVVWSRPLQGDSRAEYETIFSSLSFATR